MDPTSGSFPSYIYTEVSYQFLATYMWVIKPTVSFSLIDNINANNNNNSWRIDTYSDYMTFRKNS